MTGEQGGAAVLSNRQRRILVKDIKAQKKREAEANPRPEPVREEFIAPEIRHEDDTIIPGLTGRGTIKRLDTLDKLLKANKINGMQFCAGMDYLAIVEGYFASTSGLAKLSDEAGRVGGGGDPIRLYNKARPVNFGKGYIPTQRPRNPSYVRAHSDGWTGSKLDAMGEFSRMAKLVSALPDEPRRALCVLVIDPNRPDLAALSLSAACRRMVGSDRGRSYALVTRWLTEALNEIDRELLADRREVA